MTKRNALIAARQPRRGHVARPEGLVSPRSSAKQNAVSLGRLALRLGSLLAIIAIFAAACGSDAVTTSSGSDSGAEAEAEAATDESSEAAADEAGGDSDTKAAFIMVAPIGDAGWNFTHNEGRLGAEAATGVPTAYVDAIPEGGAEFNDAVQQFIDDGYNVIITTSFGYMDATEQFAADNPDVVFEHVSGFKMNDTNFGNTFGRMYQPRYIAGMAAGADTESNKIGYVAAFPIPEVIRGINAFALGVQRTNPDATVEVAWTSTWFDPGVEGNAAQALLDTGADVLTMHQDSTATGQKATDAGATFIGYHSDMSSQVENYLTAPVWDWSPRYADIIEAAKAGNFTPESYWGGMADGIVDIAIPDSSPVAGEMKEVKQQILDGEFDVFDQAITAQDGTQITDDDGALLVDLMSPFGDPIGAPGDAMNDGVMLGMGFFVDNVIGSTEG